MRSEQVEKKVGHVFRRPDLLEQALTHSSYAYENPAAGGVRDNELLEFLGDSVVGLAAAAYVYAAFPGRSEGELSKLKASATNTAALARLARSVRLDKALRLGRGEEKSGGRKKPSILAGVFEAVVGAVFLDGGFDPARAFVERLMAADFRDIPAEDFRINNYKSALQEHFQKDNQPPPEYRTVATRGPDHERVFAVEVVHGGRTLARARGPSKKAAEQKAAQKALKRILGRRMKSRGDEDFIIETDDD